MDDLKLKPCPACGSNPELFVKSNETRHIHDFVICLNDECRVMGPCDDPNGEKWNALPRHPEPEAEDITKLPLSELRKDLEVSIRARDAANELITLGWEKVDSLRDLRKGNSQIIEKIQAEIDRRAIETLKL